MAHTGADTVVAGITAADDNYIFVLCTDKATFR